MITKAFSGEADLNSLESEGRLEVFIAYSNVAAGRRAIHVLAGLDNGLGENLEFHPTPWSFDLLTEPCWRDVATNGAMKADILIIAADRDPLPRAVQGWLETILSHKRGTDCAVVAFGTDEPFGGTDLPFIGPIQRAAEQAGLDFFAPAVRHEVNNMMRRAGCSRPPLYRGPLQCQRPPRWGINE